jgi:NAD(P)-dependent dehydrogenase (short-subunit alcohol dehydrogenase family)
MEFLGYDKNFSLSGKVALITGAASGIGRAIANLFYEKGASLILVDLNPAVEQIGGEIAPDQARFTAAIANITEATQREAALGTGLAKFGAVDILVNSAGVALLDPALEVPEAHWDKTMELNLRALFFLTQRVASEMIKRGGGKIISLASQAGVIALDRHVAYCVSKAGVISMTKVLALEWAKYNIQVNAISPTVVVTELGKKAWAGEVGEQMKRRIPAGRFAYPEEIAACALFLASDAAAMITGENLVIDGGYTIQ